MRMARRAMHVAPASHHRAVHHALVRHSVVSFRSTLLLRWCVKLLRRRARPGMVRIGGLRKGSRRRGEYPRAGQQQHNSDDVHRSNPSKTVMHDSPARSEMIDLGQMRHGRICTYFEHYERMELCERLAIDRIHRSARATTSISSAILRRWSALLPEATACSTQWAT